MKVFVDANVLIAVLNRQYPLFSAASRILSLSERPNYEVYTSPICMAIAFYFAEKKSGKRRAREKMSVLTQKLKITTTDYETVRKAADNPSVYDFEDGLEYYSALQSGCEIIITEDVSDFYFSEIKVCNCVDFINNFMKFGITRDK